MTNNKNNDNNNENNNNSSSVKISEDVFATIAHTALLEVDGTYDYSTLAGDILEKFFKKNTKGINLSIQDKTISFTINLVVKLNFKIDEVAKAVQSKVKSAIESMTDFTVTSVNVNVIGVDISKHKIEQESNS